MTTFWETMLPVTLNMLDFLHILLDPVLDLDHDREPEFFQSRNRNRNKSLQFHNTALAHKNYTVQVSVF